MRKKDKQILLVTLIVLYIVVLMVSLFLPYGKMDLPPLKEPIYLKGYKNVWFPLTIIAFLVFMYKYSKNSNNKTAWLIVICYVMAIYFTLSRSLKIVPAWGTYIYLLSFIIFLAIFTCQGIKTKEPANYIKENPSKLDGLYLLAYNIVTNNGDARLYKSSIIYLAKKKTLEFKIYYKHDLDDIKIKVDDITEIKFEKVELLDKFEDMVETEEIADYSIASSIIKSLGPYSISKELVDNVESYFSFIPKELYLMAFIYKRDGVTKTLGFYTKENPSEFVNAISPKTK